VVGRGDVTDESSIRILWQSFQDPAEHRAYFDALGSHLTAIADPGTRFDVVGMVPPDRFLHRLTELRCSITAIRHAVYAERSGYDAVVIGHFQDSGLHDIRATVDLPVVGLGEASLQHACTLGQRIGLVTKDAAFCAFHEEQVARYGLADRLAGIAVLAIPPADLLAARGDPAAHARVVDAFAAGAERLLDSGAEVLIPAGALPSMGVGAGRNVTVGGARVVEGVAVAAKTAEAIVRVGRVSGAQPSRRSAFMKPSPEALEEFIALTGGDVRAPLQSMPTREECADGA
jgi:allantoin racemase